MANRIKVTVGGTEYFIVSDDEEAYVRSLADDLNRRLDKLSTENRYLSTTMVATYTALNLLDEYTKCEQRLKDTELELKRAREIAACARLESEEAKTEICRLNDEVLSLHNKLTDK
ncbi:MAG: cell division protein ZapA [Acutalibacteraceae bacterium]